MLALKCPSCGAPVHQQPKTVATTCAYCGTKAVDPDTAPTGSAPRVASMPPPPVHGPAWDVMAPQARLEEAIAFVRRSGYASASTLQWHFRIGYPDAARLLEVLEELGIIGPPVDGSRKRWISDPDPAVPPAQIAALALQERRDLAWRFLGADEDAGIIRAAVLAIRDLDSVSSSTLQRRLRIGYPRAVRLLNELQEGGFVGPARGPGREHQVLPRTRALPEDASLLRIPQRQNALWDEPGSSEDDPLFGEAVNLIRREGRASVSMLQRRLRIGYTRAARLVDVMEDRGIVGPPEENSPVRTVLDYGPVAPPADE